MLKLPTIFFLITLSVLAVLHIVALKLFLYWRFPWFDIPMHLFGGAVVALGIFTLHDLLRSFPARLTYLIPVLLFTIMIALAWEVFQLQIGKPIDDDYVLDTIIDVLLGATGSVIGYYIATQLQRL